MAVEVRQREVPDEKLFERWRQSDDHARDEIFTALWKNLIGIGFHTCNAAFRFYRGREALSEDVAREAFVQMWQSLSQRVLAGEFEWQGAAKFHAYCHKAYRHTLTKLINKQHQRGHTETSFDSGSDSRSGEQDPGHKRTRTTQELIALVHYFSLAAQRLHDQGQEKEAEIANLIVHYVKCEVARHSEVFRGSGNNLAVEQIATQPIEKLLDGVPADRLPEIGLETDSQAFRTFLMQQLCDFKLGEDMRAKYCDILQVDFTIHEKDGRRRRITQEELMQAHKRKRRQTPKDPLVDEAYQALTGFLRNRALVDQRWGRFKKAYEALLV